MGTPNVLKPRRIGVCGSSADLTKEAVVFCEAVGARLASEPNVVIVSGGTRRRERKAEDNLAAEWYVVSAAERALRALPDPELIEKRIETVVSDNGSRTERFKIGCVRTARGNTREARRFSFVRAVDALITVGGRGGTEQELALALELELPVMPVPLFGMASKEYWRAYRDDLVRLLALKDDVVKRWERRPPRNRKALQNLGVEMVEALLRSLPRRVFVVMPFSEDFTTLYDSVIKPAIVNAGDIPIRLDQDAFPGDVGSQIRDGIRLCDYAIVVLDGLRANVLYELGLAHGAGKTTVLLNRVGTFGEGVMAPFDLLTQQRLEYSSVDDHLCQRLKSVLEDLPTRRR